VKYFFKEKRKPLVRKIDMGSKSELKNLEDMEDSGMTQR